jgi:CheY-like chemotaxis protein
LSLRTARGERPNLLLAEDSDPVRVVTAAMLKGMGCNVEAVVHGEEAVQYAGERRFDVIVLDIEMPVMDGITAAKSIRRMGGIAEGTPIMALSAFLADAMRTNHWQDTFDIALPKPANKNELHDAVRTALAWQNKPATADTDGLPPLISLPELEAIRSGITAGVWRELAGLACRDITTCANELERLETSRLTGAIVTFATKLRALGRTFAAPRLAHLSRQVQLTDSPGDRRMAIRRLVATARDTVRALQA